MTKAIYQIKELTQKWKFVMGRIYFGTTGQLFGKSHQEFKQKQDQGSKAPSTSACHQLNIELSIYIK